MNNGSVRRGPRNERSGYFGGVLADGRKSKERFVQWGRGRVCDAAPDVGQPTAWIDVVQLGRGVGIDLLRCPTPVRARADPVTDSPLELSVTAFLERSCAQRFQEIEIG